MLQALPIDSNYRFSPHNGRAYSSSKLHIRCWYFSTAKAGYVVANYQAVRVNPFPIQSDMLLLRFAVLQHCLRLRV